MTEHFDAPEDGGYVQRPPDDPYISTLEPGTPINDRITLTGAAVQLAGTGGTIPVLIIHLRDGKTRRAHQHLLALDDGLLEHLPPLLTKCITAALESAQRLDLTTAEPTEARCILCNVRIFGAIAIRGTCLGCDPHTPTLGAREL